MIIIPIGADCGVAELLKKYNLRNASYPFDWIVTYGGISKIIENDFLNFIPNECGKGVLHSTYNMWMVHYDFPKDTEKIERRIKRFTNLLEGSQEEIVFLRKGHWKSHHDECSKFFCKEISNDITEAENLDIILKTKYPNLKYSIVLLLVCGKCYQPDDIYKPTSSNITIHNIAMDPGANEPVENKFVELFVYK
jgi:hypothetical protein